MSFARRASAALVAAAVLGPASAHAAPTDSALAEGLFREGKKLMGRHAYAAACPKLAESQRLDPGGGTLLTLALCHEALGKIASAWSEFEEAATIARRDGRGDRERIARKHAKALEGKLSYVTVTVAVAVAGKPPAGFELKKDETVLGEGAWGTPTPIDPGEHTLTATAPAHKPWSTTFRISSADPQVTVTVPPLEPEPIAPSAPPAARDTPADTVADTPPAPPPQAASGGGVRVVGVVTLAAGVLAAGAGVFLGARAASQVEDANAICPEKACADASALALNADASANATAANILVGAGLVAMVGGLVMVLAGGPSAPARAGRVSVPLGVWTTTAGAGAALRGGW